MSVQPAKAKSAIASRDGSTMMSPEQQPGSALLRHEVGSASVVGSSRNSSSVEQSIDHNRVIPRRDLSPNNEEEEVEEEEEEVEEQPPPSSIPIKSMLSDRRDDKEVTGADGLGLLVWKREKREEKT
jgi:hypothetical protein